MSDKHHYKVLEYSSLDSTQSEAKRLIEAKNVSFGTVIVAKRQLSGYGRKDRSWVSDEGDITITIILEAVNKAETLSYVFAVAVGETLRQLLPRENMVKYKWVNDILVNSKKISGILIEKFDQYVLVGIGINIVKGYVGGVGLCQFGREVTRQEVLQLLLENCEKYYRQWSTYGLLKIRNMWMKDMIHKNELMRINNVLGYFIEIDEEGNLLLESDNKRIVVRNIDY